MNPENIHNKKYEEPDDQWNGNGKCNLCRRQKYCGTKCNKYKERIKYENYEARLELFKKMISQGGYL